MSPFPLFCPIFARSRWAEAGSQLFMHTTVVDTHLQCANILNFVSKCIMNIVHVVPYFRCKGPWVGGGGLAAARYKFGLRSPSWWNQSWFL